MSINPESKFPVENVKTFTGFMTQIDFNRLKAKICVVIDPDSDFFGHNVVLFKKDIIFDTVHYKGTSNGSFTFDDEKLNFWVDYFADQKRIYPPDYTILRNQLEVIGDL